MENGIKRGRKAILSMILAGSLLAGCQSAGSSEGRETVESSIQESQGSAEIQNIELTESAVDTEFTQRDSDSSYEAEEAEAIVLLGNTASADATGVSVEGSTVTIGAEGVYVISGTLENGQIVVEASESDKVQLVLNAAVIHSETGAAIYVKQADKVVLTLAEDSVNELQGGAESMDTENDTTVDGVIFSKADISINGSGALDITAEGKHGIVSKDDLVITGGRIQVDAVSQCLSGKDCIKISGGEFLLTTQGKAVKSENSEDASLGNIYIQGGTFVINAQDDAFHAGGSIVVDGGAFQVDTQDDAFHADADLVINEGEITVNTCNEGLEGHRVVINGGTVSVISGDDAVNAAAPTEQSETALQRQGTGQRGENGGQNGGGSMEADSDAYIKITGGTLTVTPQGDGLDSNGNLYLTGGTVVIHGPAGGGDSSLDYNGEAVVTGGTLMAAGSGGMAQTFGASSAQPSILQVLDGAQAAGTEITLEDSKGNTVLNDTPSNAYECVLLTSPDLTAGEAYSLKTGTETSAITLDDMANTNQTGGRRSGKAAPGGQK